MRRARTRKRQQHGKGEAFSAAASCSLYRSFLPLNATAPGVGRTHQADDIAGMNRRVPLAAGRAGRRLGSICLLLAPRLIFAQTGGGGNERMTRERGIPWLRAPANDLYLL